MAYWDAFCEWFDGAITEIDREHFSINLPENEEIYRERAYCYELYHRLRCKQAQYDRANFPYTIHGEIDKRGRVDLPEIFEKYSNPDFIVHIPGNMGDEDNLVVIEVKTINKLTEDKVLRDLTKIQAYMSKPLRYQHGIFLIFGNGDLTPTVKKYIEDNNTEPISILHHDTVGKAPIHLKGPYKI